MSFDVSSLNNKLSMPTSFFGLQLWALIVICILFFFLLILFFLSLCIIYCRRRKSHEVHFRLPKPVVAKNFESSFSTSSLDRRLLSRNISEVEMGVGKPEHQVVISDRWSSQASGTIGMSNATDVESLARNSLVISDIAWGNRYTLREIEEATNGFADGNMIGNGGNGVVYRGVLFDNTLVAVKKLLSTSGQAEEFIVEVDAIGSVRHKNLVKLLGYCMEVASRMLVYEYVDNGSLHQWLHGCVGQVSPLTWGIRMNIVLGMAKGLAYLHEDIEPKFVHRDIKSSNILLDHKWNPKISDFGLAKLLGLEWNNVTTRAMRTSGYVAPEYASTGFLNEKSDVYSFGILIMEIISGRIPIDHSQPQVNLIDWLKSMVANQKSDFVVDPKLPEMPSSKELKRVLLIALRCVDPDAKSRPKMGDVIHMLEPRDLLLGDECRIRRESSRRRQENQAIAKLSEGAFGTNEGESSGNRYQKMLPK